MHDRRKDIALISREQRVDPESNYSFGEGGAGAFSDGKLYTRSKKRGSVERILQIFCQHGVSILSDAHPHIGTDKLPRVIERMRNRIIESGGAVHFETRMERLIIDGDEVCGIVTADGREFTGPVILATGHSARDVYYMLHENGVELESKGIAVGVRLEHPQQLIDSIQYHNPEGRGKYLPAAKYSFVTQVKGRGVYSFCMCPGGSVCAAASEENAVVTNGMSYHARSGKNANAAVVVSVNGTDFANDPRQAIAFQRELEAKAYAAGRAAGAYAAPAENVQSFLEGRGQLHIGSVQPTYDRGVTAADLGALLPGELADTLRAGLRAYERKIAGYTAPDAILTGLETRTSSPVRLKREEDFVCTQLAGLYPCGEGAGYAGGIMSAAVDGLRVARAIISRYAPAEG